MTLRNYRPLSHFVEKYKKELQMQFQTIFDLKKNDSPNYELDAQHLTLRADKSDKYTIIKHLRNINEVISVSDNFEGRVVVDVGSGFGGCYYALRFGNPKKLIAIDPSKENIEIAQALGYDECHHTGWEEFKFPAQSVVFLRGLIIPDYSIFFKKMQDDGVCDIIFIQTFITNDLPCHAHLFHNPIQNKKVCRWLYNRPTPFILPSVGELQAITPEYNFGLMLQKPLNRVGFSAYKSNEIKNNKECTEYIIHFSKVDG